MGKLTALTIKTRKETGKYPDGGGLLFEITSTGLKRWLYRFRLDGKQKIFTIGHYPEISLSEARALHIEARKLVSAGINPTSEKRGKKRPLDNELLKTTFSNIALEWQGSRKVLWTDGHAMAVLTHLMFQWVPSQVVETR